MDLGKCHIHTALYLTDLLDHGAFSHVINSVVYSIKWAHQLCNVSDLTDNNMSFASLRVFTLLWKFGFVMNWYVFFLL